MHRKSLSFILMTALFPFAAAQPAPAPVAAQAAAPAAGTFEEARRHLVRGAAALETAKSDADLALAADEFRMATEKSPEWAFAWMNLGQVQVRLGRLPQAMASYKRYLALAPNDKDAGRIGDELIKLEFRMEQAARIQNRSGVWVGELGMPYQATAKDSSLLLRCGRQPMTNEELVANTFLGGEAALPLRELRLELQGERVTGTSTRSEVPVGKCVVPAETVEVEGTYDEAAGRLELRIPRSRFQARTSLNIFLDPVGCAGVSVRGKDTVNVVLYGPLPAGGIGAQVALDYPGHLMIGYHPWQGRLGLAARQTLDPRLKEIGFQEKDEILAIDGVAVNTLGPAEAIRSLRGVPGSEICLTVLHPKAKQPVTLTFPRVAVASPDLVGNRYESWGN